MKLRCELHLNGKMSRVILFAKPEETLNHLALKLAAYAMFMPLNPIVEPSSDHPSLTGYEHKPDVMALSEGGDIDLWIECGQVSINKLDKLTRRLHNTRVIVIKPTLREAKQLREFAMRDVKHQHRFDIWTWKNGDFDTWVKALDEKVEIYGEAREKSFNLVINNTAYCVDLISV